MSKSLLSGLILVLSVLHASATDNLLDPMSDIDIRNEMTALLDKYNKNENNIKDKDCVSNATINTLKWLKEETYNGKELDKKRIDSVKLRLFLQGKGFLKSPGSVVMINTQDDTLRLICGADKTSTDYYSWESKGRMEDDKFNNDNKKAAVQLNDIAPAYHLYFRTYKCSHSAKTCEHTFYIFTKPFPKVQYPQQYREGDDLTMTCSINPCLYSNKKSTETDGCAKAFKMDPNFIAPSKFYWTFPGVDKNIESQADVPNLKNVTGWENTHVSVSWNKWKKNVKKPYEDNKFYNGFTISSTVKIANVTKVHAGRYECIIQDENGLTSTPGKDMHNHKNNKPSIDDLKFKGSVIVHVREWYWIYVPMVALAVMGIITLIIQFGCPLHMEHDDGKAFTKEELDDHHRAKKSKLDTPEPPKEEIAPVTEETQPEVAGSVEKVDESSPPPSTEAADDPKASKTTLRGTKKNTK